MFSFLENHVLQCILTLKFPEVIQILPHTSLDQYQKYYIIDKKGF